MIVLSAMLVHVILVSIDLTGYFSLYFTGYEAAFWMKFRTKILLVTIEVIADEYRLFFPILV
jgi:hypothetical protein